MEIRGLYGFHRFVTEEKFQTSNIDVSERRFEDTVLDVYVPVVGESPLEIRCLVEET